MILPLTNIYNGPSFTISASPSGLSFIGEDDTVLLNMDMEQAREMMIDVENGHDYYADLTEDIEGHIRFSSSRTHVYMGVYRPQGISERMIVHKREFARAFALTLSVA